MKGRSGGVTCRANTKKQGPNHRVGDSGLDVGHVNFQMVFGRSDSDINLRTAPPPSCWNMSIFMCLLREGRCYSEMRKIQVDPASACTYDYGFYSKINRTNSLS
ncbi:hypothetical protein MLD38_036283 [Melastoma candidum]|uniref:Uncharacterized protein n=1 Tax=Melastoma candidum TaxID=119954 RepID=A0ACB9LIQ9_9MYRT|nr:hypothetical protein MLD38_036283 [Melastoma candidum]